MGSYSGRTKMAVMPFTTGKSVGLSLVSLGKARVRLSVSEFVPLPDAFAFVGPNMSIAEFVPFPDVFAFVGASEDEGEFPFTGFSIKLFE